MYFNFRNDIWDLIQKSYPTGYCPDIYHPVTQSDSLQTKINYLQHKRQNVTVEVSVKGELGSYFPKECIALHAPPQDLILLTKLGANTSPSSSVVISVLLAGVCRIQVPFFREPPSSFWWIISNSRVYWEVQSGGGGAATFSHPYHRMRDTSEGRSLTGLVHDSQAEFHNGVVSQGPRMPDYVTP